MRTRKSWTPRSRRPRKLKRAPPRLVKAKAMAVAVAAAAAAVGAMATSPARMLPKAMTTARWTAKAAPRLKTKLAKAQLPAHRRKVIAMARTAAAAAGVVVVAVAIAATRMASPALKAAKPP